MDLSRERRDDPTDIHQLVPYLLNRAVRGFNREWLGRLRVHGVTIGRWQVLAILREYDGARLGQLASMSGAEQAVTSRVVDQMERDGLVSRRPAPDDGRAVEVWLTPTGRQLFTELLPEADALVASALRGVDGPALDVLTRALTTVIANLDDPLVPDTDAAPSAAGTR